jgi:phosphate acetyltransferase
MDQGHQKYKRLIERAKALPPLPTAVAHPCDESSLGAQAHREDPSKAVA